MEISEQRFSFQIVCKQTTFALRSSNRRSNFKLASVWIHCPRCIVSNIVLTGRLKAYSARGHLRGIMPVPSVLHILWNRNLVHIWWRRNRTLSLSAQVRNRRTLLNVKQTLGIVNNVYFQFTVGHCSIYHCGKLDLDIPVFNQL